MLRRWGQWLQLAWLIWVRRDAIGQATRNLFLVVSDTVEDLGWTRQERSRVMTALYKLVRAIRGRPEPLK